MLALRYRAHNIDTHNTLTCVWIYEGQNNASFPLIDFDKLIVDGEIHEIQIDLPKVPVDSKGTPFENGPVKGLTVSVLNTEVGEGSIELVDLKFVSATKPARKAEPDNALHVRLLNPDGTPVKHAVVNVDPERKDAAKSAITDGDGAMLTPDKNELGIHAIEVHVDGLVSVTKTIKADQQDTIEISPPKGMQIGGFVQDEDGKPIEGATVEVFIFRNQVGKDPAVRTRQYAEIHTDAKGQWLSPALPDTEQINLAVSHTDYVSDQGYKQRDDILDELKSGIATIVLKK